MIECPECWHQFQGDKCPACGYKIQRPVVKTRLDESVYTNSASLWLKDHGIINGKESREERLLKLSDYRKRLSNIPNVATAEPRAWAGEVLSRISEGISYPTHIEKMAREAIGYEVESGGN